MQIEYRLKQRYFRVFNKELDLNNPILFTEKLQYLKIHEDLQLKTVCADKLKVQDYFIKILNKNIGFTIFNIFYDVNGLDSISQFPVIAKCNHGSGMNAIFRSTRDIQLYKCLFERWLKIDYSNKCIEPWYSNIKPCILIEPYIENFQEVEVFVFNGIPKIIEILDDNAHRYYDTKWNRLNWLKRVYHQSPLNITDDKPLNLDEICSISSMLAKPFKFVRVDFMVDKLNNNFYCSEMTFAPGAGFCIYDGDGDRILGDMLEIK